jgi:hypothetical protein
MTMSEIELLYTALDGLSKQPLSEVTTTDSSSPDFH